MGKQLELGATVECRWGELSHRGRITQVNDEDQGDFEYYVTNDDGTGSFWPRECLRVLDPKDDVWPHVGYVWISVSEVARAMQISPQRAGRLLMEGVHSELIERRVVNMVPQYRRLVNGRPIPES